MYWWIRWHESDVLNALQFESQSNILCHMKEHHWINCCCYMKPRSSYIFFLQDLFTMKKKMNTYYYHIRLLTLLCLCKVFKIILGPVSFQHVNLLFCQKNSQPKILGFSVRNFTSAASIHLSYHPAGLLNVFVRTSWWGNGKSS